MHHHLDATLEIEGAIKEQKNKIYYLDGYGWISGSTDLFVEPHVVDYKVVGKWSFDKMKVAWNTDRGIIPTTTYRVQQHLYGYGWIKAGHTVEDVTLCVIPKLSNDPDDIRFYTEPYNQAVVDRALARLDRIWKYVQEGRLNDLPMNDDCYTCTRVLFRA